MPIKHLLETRGRFPRLGVIRLGVKVEGQNGKSYPKASDHFVVDTALATALGTETPTEIEVAFPDNDPDRVVDAYYRQYEGSPDNPAGGVLVFRCDGITAAHLPRDGKPHAEPCRKAPFDPANPEAARAPCPCGAKAVARLNVVCIKGGIGTYQLVFGGEGRIADVLNDLWIGRRAFGRLVGVPARLTLEKVSMEFRDKQGKRQKREGWAPRIRWQHTYQQALGARGQDPLALDVATGDIVEGPRALAPAPPEVEHGLPAGHAHRGSGQGRPAGSAPASRSAMLVETEPADLYDALTQAPADKGRGDLLMDCARLSRQMDVSASAWSDYLASRVGTDPALSQLREVYADLFAWAKTPHQSAAFKASCRAAEIAAGKKR